MFRKQLLLILASLALMTMACRFLAMVPSKEYKVGPTVTDEINVPLLADPGATARVELAFGAGELILRPGAEGSLVKGKATYNVAEFKPNVTLEGNQARIIQGNGQIEGFPKIGDNYRNTWDLQLGVAPLDLSIKAGAYQGRIELGGLSLEGLHVTDGAADVELSFSEPNRVEMESLRYDSGASKVTLSGLANANFTSMEFKGGAGDYTFNFSGELQHDATVSIESGLSNTTIIVPEGVSARLSIDGGLTNVDIGGQWQASGGDYVLSGDGPTLTFIVKMGAGNLGLRNR